MLQGLLGHISGTTSQGAGSLAGFPPQIGKSQGEGEAEQPGPGPLFVVHPQEPACSSNVELSSQEAILFVSRVLTYMAAFPFKGQSTSVGVDSSN